MKIVEADSYKILLTENITIFFTHFKKANDSVTTVYLYWHENLIGLLSFENGIEFLELSEAL
jgi:hypothetical protein